MESLKIALAEYWPLDENTGDRTSVAGQGDVLTNTGTATQAAGPRRPGTALASASSQRLIMSSNSRVQMGDIDFTIAFWTYFVTKPAVASLVIKYAAVAGQYDYQAWYDGTADRAKFTVTRAVDAAQTVTASSAGSLALSTWHFIVCWHDAVADTISIQVNNGAVDSVATGGALQAASASGLGVGAVHAGGNYMNGRMAGLGMWKRLLSANEQAFLWNGGNGREYPFDGVRSPMLLEPKHLHLVPRNV